MIPRYNPHTRKPKTIIVDIITYTTAENFRTGWHPAGHVFSSYEDALLNGEPGSVLFMAPWNGATYVHKGKLVLPEDWIPVADDGSTFEPGDPWERRYFNTAEAAQAYWNTLPEEAIKNVKEPYEYLEDYDVYVVSSYDLNWKEPEG